MSVLRARYRLSGVDPAHVHRRALAIAREQTLEVPSGAATPEIEAALLGRVLSATPHPDGTDAFAVEIAYPLDLFDGTLTQLLNVVWGNVSLMEGVRLENLHLPDAILTRLPGPGHGIRGIRERVRDGDGRPLVSGALKPVGLSVDELADLARRLVRAGVDVIKDDHGLANQKLAPFEPRARAVAEAVADENARTGHRALYFPNVTAPLDQLVRRTEVARDAGCPGVVVCPALTGMDALRVVREMPDAPIVMAHPSHADTAPGARRGIAPPLLIGTLWRLAGADCVIYVNAGGRFAWPLETCRAINARAREPLGAHHPSFPVPAGGIEANEVEHWFRSYGPDTLLLIGGSVLEADDVEAAARAVVEAAHRAHRPASPDPAADGRPRAGGESETP